MQRAVSLTSQLQFLCRLLLTGETVIPVSLIAVVPTILKKSVFQLRISQCSICFPWGTVLIKCVHCCLVTTRAFMPASLTVIPLEFLGQFRLTTAIILKQMGCHTGQLYCRSDTRMLMNYACTIWPKDFISELGLPSKFYLLCSTFGS